MAKKRVLAGIQPTGNIHIGNYFGSIKQMIDLQNNDDTENWYFIADLHAMTMPYKAPDLRENTIKSLMIYLAFGLKPENSTIFLQSMIPAHAELCWILNCNTPVGWMNQMIQFKEKSLKTEDDSVSVGLMDYPVLMAADILLYNTDLVPVGEDQLQHVEITREIARRFNRTFGNVFMEPEAYLPPKGDRIMGLDDASKKMSKSAKSKYNYINLLDSPDEIVSKISKAVTDDEKSIVFDEKRKAIYNLLTIYHLVTKEDEQAIEEKFSGKNYVEFKNDLAERMIEFLKPHQEKYFELEKNIDYVEEIIAQGVGEAMLVANDTIRKVKKKAGLLEKFDYNELKSKPVISFEDWLKLDVEIGTIKDVIKVEDADKLYQLVLDFGPGGETTIVAGIREYYEPDELIGKQVPILKNLEEKEIRGIKSKGMLLAINSGGEAIILNPQKEAKSGDKVS